MVTFFGPSTTSIEIQICEIHIEIQINFRCSKLPSSITVGLYTQYSTVSLHSSFSLSSVVALRSISCWDVESLELAYRHFCYATAPSVCKSSCYKRTQKLDLDQQQHLKVP